MGIPFAISSDQASTVLKYYKCVADAIYIDASHEQGDVYRDIVNFWEFLKPGGVLFGDDYDHKNWPGVVHDVDKFVKEYNVTLKICGVVWFILK